jgi:hypothetical protein
MSDAHCHEAQLNDLESEWRLLHEAALIAEREYRIVAQRLRAEADRFEIVKERFEIAEILEARSLAKLESLRKQRGITPICASSAKTAIVADIGEDNTRN